MSKSKNRYLEAYSPSLTKEIETLKQMGYDVQRFTAWHYRVGKVTRDFVVDIFPTTNTYVVRKEGTVWKGKKYKDLLYLIETELQ